MDDSVNKSNMCGKSVEREDTISLEHRPIAAEPQAPNLPEWIEIPEWAKNTFIDQWLRNWIIPEALRRGYKTVWLRATAEHKHYLQPVLLTP